jgi:uncharacterized protein YdeI (YjbR/CyaY-like superfamily)
VSEDVLYLKSKAELKEWYIKNHKKTDKQWLGFYKKTALKQSLSMVEANELALAFGWTGVVIKSVDIWSYKIKFMKRKPGSVWGNAVIKKFKELKAQKLIQASGQRAFDQRDIKKSENKVKALKPAQLVEFKKNKAAWNFFESQTASYRKYMVYWVTSAKREETQKKRLSELIADSESGTKLRRILLAQERVKPKYEEGKTPIEAARNLGITTGMDLRAVGISTLEQLQRVGWEKALAKVVEICPHQLNLNFFRAVVGAAEGQDRKKLDVDLKQQAF